MKSLLLLPLLLAVNTASVCLAATNEKMNELVESLVQRLPGKGVKLGMGKFLYGDTELESELSFIFREEMETALTKIPAVQIIVRSNIDQLQDECEFQSTDLFIPQEVSGSLKLKGVDGLVWGKFVNINSVVTLHATIAWVNGGNVTKETMQWTKDDIPGYEGKSLSDDELQRMVRPHNAERSMKGIEEVTNKNVLDVPRDISIRFSTADGERLYREGDTIAFSVQASEACHIAVICHQNDGNSVVLFPNKWHPDTAVPANRWVMVPGDVKSGFEIEIAEPFGGDVVQVIACTDPALLHKEIGSMASAATEDDPYPVMSRGMVVKKAKAASESKGASSARWGEAHMIINTIPANEH